MYASALTSPVYGTYGLGIEHVVAHKCNLCEIYATTGSHKDSNNIAMYERRTRYHN